MAEEAPRANAVTNDADVKYVTLREFENRLHDSYVQICQKLDYEVQMQREREAARDTALEKQASEYLRRLDELNHAHETAKDNWARSLPREVFENHLNEYRRFSQEVGLALQSAAKAVAQVETFDRRFTSVVSVDAMNAFRKELQLLQQNQDKTAGALTVIRFMGFAGVIALVLGFLRLTGMIQT